MPDYPFMPKIPTNRESSSLGDGSVVNINDLAEKRRLTKTILSPDSQQSGLNNALAPDDNYAEIMGRAYQTLRDTQGTQDVLSGAGDRQREFTMNTDRPQHSYPNPDFIEGMAGAGSMVPVPQIAVPSAMILGGFGANRLIQNGLQGVKDHPVMSALDALGMYSGYSSMKGAQAGMAAAKAAANVPSKLSEARAMAADPSYSGISRRGLGEMAGLTGAGQSKNTGAFNTKLGQTFDAGNKGDWEEFNKLFKGEYPTRPPTPSAHPYGPEPAPSGSSFDEEGRWLSGPDPKSNFDGYERPPQHDIDPNFNGGAGDPMQAGSAGYPHGNGNGGPTVDAMEALAGKLKGQLGPQSIVGSNGNGNGSHGGPLAWSDHMIDTPDGSTLAGETGRGGTAHPASGLGDDAIRALKEEAMKRFQTATADVEKGSLIPQHEPLTFPDGMGSGYGYKDPMNFDGVPFGQGMPKAEGNLDTVDIRKILFGGARQAGKDDSMIPPHFREPLSSSDVSVKKVHPRAGETSKSKATKAQGYDRAKDAYLKLAFESLRNTKP